MKEMFEEDKHDNQKVKIVSNDINEELYTKIENDNNEISFYYKMISFISYKERTEEEIKNKLYKYHLKKDESGTKIYSDYIFEMYEEFPNVKEYVNRAIVDTLFVDENIIPIVLRDYKRLNKENASFLLESLKMTHPNNYSTGYLYLKTNITKDE